jgi:hypothetical protein
MLCFVVLDFQTNMGGCGWLLSLSNTKTVSHHGCRFKVFTDHGLFCGTAATLPTKSSWPIHAWDLNIFNLACLIDAQGLVLQLVQIIPSVRRTLWLSQIVMVHCTGSVLLTISKSLLCLQSSVSPLTLQCNQSIHSINAAQ